MRQIFIVHALSDPDKRNGGKKQVGKRDIFQQLVERHTLKITMLLPKGGKVNSEHDFQGSLVWVASTVIRWAISKEMR